MHENVKFNKLQANSGMSLTSSHPSDRRASTYTTTRGHLCRTARYLGRELGHGHERLDLLNDLVVNVVLVVGLEVGQQLVGVRQDALLGCLPVVLDLLAHIVRVVLIK